MRCSIQPIRINIGIAENNQRAAKLNGSICIKLTATSVGFTDTMIEKLMNYKWPGNVRELKNVIESVVYYTENDNHPIDPSVNL